MKFLRKTFKWFLRFFQKQKNEEGKENQTNEYQDIVRSMFECAPLYDKLKTKCHPDIFPHNKEKQVLANELFQELQKCRHNIVKLKELEIKINELLKK